MKIIADAWSKETGKVHTLVDTPLDAECVDPAKDGVEITLKSNAVSLSGEFRLRLQLTIEEAAALYQGALQRPLLAQIDQLKMEIDMLRAGRGR
jgi:hypothetical protein